MKAISLHQPWASLCVTRQPPPPCPDAGRYNDCHGTGRFWYDEDTPMAGQVPAGWRNCYAGCPAVRPMVKRFETRGWPCPPNLIGQRIALHATARDPDSTGAPRECWDAFDHGDSLPTGAVVGSAVIEACYPITYPGTSPDPDVLTRVAHDGADLLLRYHYAAGLGCGIEVDNLSDQLPYGDFTPGRYAWLLTDAQPTTERCPWCWGEGWIDARTTCHDTPCPVCDTARRCEPIPAKGRQRIWNWQP